ncbi:tyrosine-type recombinase/integrase [Pseudoalteromonas sp. SCQQ13]|uniref:tyrosine-type recombinase/integrase n=1 Tax=Pseudoalteromonas sp. SCQQ13 TaxID=2792066 RepID=UPI0018CD34E8|nr:integrase family protein [Pseudoalteromonas sp. SCQQ13]MBH0092852.1 integrase family protein [Pseudoalteromonas sp. SCQQ13]
MKITAAKLKSINGKAYTGKPEIADGDNLSLRISPKGKISFQIRHRLNGKQVRYKIGEYPAITLAQAREACAEKMALANQNLDPRKMEAVSAVEVEQIENPTINDCVEYWYKNYCLLKRDSPEDIKLRITSCLNNTWKNQYVSLMNKSHFTALFKSMSEVSSARGRGDGFVFNAIIEIRSMFRFCIRQGFISNSQFEALKPSDFATDYDSREHYLTIKECQLIWSNVDLLSITDRNKVMLRCAMVFGCRISELCKAQKTDFDLDNKLFTTQRGNSKGALHSIIRPIPDVLLEDLRHIKSQSPTFKYMFHNRDGDYPASSASASRIAAACHENIAGVSEFRMHDFRRTISTHLTDAGCPLQFTEKLLGHKMKGVLAIYNKSPMLDGITEWVNRWVLILKGEQSAL